MSRLDIKYDDNTFNTDENQINIRWLNSVICIMNLWFTPNVATPTNVRFRGNAGK